MHSLKLHLPEFFNTTHMNVHGAFSLGSYQKVPDTKKYIEVETEQSCDNKSNTVNQAANHMYQNMHTWGNICTLKDVNQ